MIFAHALTCPSSKLARYAARVLPQTEFRRCCWVGVVSRVSLMRMRICTHRELARDLFFSGVHLAPRFSRYAIDTSLPNATGLMRWETPPASTTSRESQNESCAVFMQVSRKLKRPVDDRIFAELLVAPGSNATTSFAMTSEGALMLFATPQGQVGDYS